MRRAMVLLFNIMDERLESIASLARSLGIAVKAVLPEEFGMSLGALCGMPGQNGKTGTDEPFTDEMMLLANLTQEQFHAFLDGFKRQGIRGVPLKAMLTPTNAGWDARRLHADLSCEYEAFRKSMQGRGKA